MTPEPYYQDDLVTLYHGDCREVTAWLDADVLVTDPPYGIDYQSGSRRREGNARSIEGDTDTAARDDALTMWADRGAALVFGSPKVTKPAGTKGTLVWDKGGALGMGDLSMPWRFDHEEVYVIGRGFVGRRDSGSVLRFPPVQSVGRAHPHQKPSDLLERLIMWCPPGVVADPFAGSGTTMLAAKTLGRKAIGVEVDRGYCDLIVSRLGGSIGPVGPDTLFGEAS